jgi:hypothetical protein
MPRPAKPRGVTQIRLLMFSSARQSEACGAHDPHTIPPAWDFSGGCPSLSSYRFSGAVNRYRYSLPFAARGGLEGGRSPPWPRRKKFMPPLYFLQSPRYAGPSPSWKGTQLPCIRNLLTCALLGAAQGAWLSRAGRGVASVVPQGVPCCGEREGRPSGESPPHLRHASESPQRPVPLVVVTLTWTR